MESILQNNNQKHKNEHQYCSHQLQIRRWSESFDRLLEDPNGIENFLQYSESEHSSENIRFWIACDKYEKSSPEKMATKARAIYDEFLSKDVENQVNLDAFQLKDIDRLMERPNAWTFEHVQRYIFVLMKRNSYPRFLKSQHYENLLKNTCVHDKDLSAESIKEVNESYSFD